MRVLLTVLDALCLPLPAALCVMRSLNLLVRWFGYRISVCKNHFGLGYAIWGPVPWTAARASFDEALIVWKSPEILRHEEWCRQLDRIGGA